MQTAKAQNQQPSSTPRVLRETATPSPTKICDSVDCNQKRGSNPYKGVTSLSASAAVLNNSWLQGLLAEDSPKEFIRECVDILVGDSCLGHLNDSAKVMLLGAAFERWASSPKFGRGFGVALFDKLKTVESSDAVVGKAWIKHVVNMAKNDKNMVYNRGQLLKFLEQIDTGSLSRLLASVSATEARLIVDVLDGDVETSAPFFAEPRLKLLRAISSADVTKGTAALVYEVATRLTSESDWGSLNGALAEALAKVQYPDDGAKQANLSTALQALLSTHKGRSAFLGGPSFRNQTMLTMLAKDPNKTLELLQSGASIQSKVFADAMAEVIVPSDASGREIHLSRISQILQTSSGHALFFGENGQSQQMRVSQAMMRQLVLSNAKITVKVISDLVDPDEVPDLRPTDYGNPWLNPKLMEFAAASFSTTNRSDTPVQLNGYDVENLVGVSLGAELVIPHGLTEQQTWAKVKDGSISPYVLGSSGLLIGNISKKIRSFGGPSPQVTVLPVTYSSTKNGLYKLPVFRVESGDQTVKFIDSQGADYDDFDEYIKKNQLPSGLMVVPKDGKISLCGPYESLKLESYYTPNTVDTYVEKGVGIIDQGLMIGGIASTLGLVAGLTPVGVAAGVGLAASGWFSGRDAQRLWARSDIGLPISLENPEARRQWLGIAANLTGVGALGSELSLARAVAKGTQITKTGSQIMGAARVSSFATNTTALANESAYVAPSLTSLDPEERLGAVLQLSYYGASAALGARQAKSFNELLNPFASAKGLLNTYEPQIIYDKKFIGVKTQKVAENGEWQILAAKDSDTGLVNIHKDVVRAMANDRGLSGIVRKIFGPSPGSHGYMVKYEGLRIKKRLESLQSELNSPNLSSQRQAQIQAELSTILSHQQTLIESGGQLRTATLHASETKSSSRTSKRVSDSKIDGRDILNQVEAKYTEFKSMIQEQQKVVTLIELDVPDAGKNNPNLSLVSAQDKIQAFSKLGYSTRRVLVSPKTSSEHFEKLLRTLNSDDKVSGVVFQPNLPNELKQKLGAISSHKDIESISDRGSLVPSAEAEAIFRLVQPQLRSDHQVVIRVGERRVGMDVVGLLRKEGLEPVVIDKNNTSLAPLKSADIIISAADQPKSLTTSHLSRKKPIVIDTGRVAKGDVAPGLSAQAKSVTSPQQLAPIQTAVLSERLMLRDLMDIVDDLPQWRIQLKRSKTEPAKVVWQ